MNWNRLYGLRSYLKSSLWVVPLIAVPLALVVSRLLHVLDARLGWSLLDFGAAGAQQLSLLDREIERIFIYREDLALAQIVDAQGLGGHSGKVSHLK